MNDREIVILFPDGARSFKVLRNIQTGFGVHPAGTSSQEVKRSGREADHSYLSIADVKNAWNYASPPANAFMTLCLI